MTDHLRQRIEAAWSLSSTFRPDLWTFDNPAIGQCGVTTLYLFDNFGGRMVEVWLEPEKVTRHFFNFINGKMYDLTWKQFNGNPPLFHLMPIERGDILANEWFEERYRNFLKSLKKQI